MSQEIDQLKILNKMLEDRIEEIQNKSTIKSDKETKNNNGQVKSYDLKREFLEREFQQ